MNNDHPIPRLPLLQVQGSQIVDDQNQPVRLRGACLGGWMNMESFINGFPGVESSQRSVMAQVLGPARAEFFFERWQEHFLGEADIAWIRQLGANVVRVPLNYRQFERDAAPFKYIEAGFNRLGRLVDWCRKYNLYVILDLHAVQGCQNPDWHSDNLTQHALFWKHPHFQDRFVALWQEIARRYTGDPVIAGYDLMNEPLTNAASVLWGGAYTPNWEVINRVYRGAVEGIRSVDREHIIFLEGDGFGTSYEGLEAPFDRNLAYSSHNYNRAGWGPGAYPGQHREGYWDRDFLVEVFLNHAGTRFAHSHQVPLWVGEFGSVFNGAPEDRLSRLRGFADQISVFEQFGAHWTGWTYKDLGVMGWVTVDPESEYVQRIAPLLRSKLSLHTDSWMYWLPVSPAKQKLGELAELVLKDCGAVKPDARVVRDEMVKLALGGYAAGLMQMEFARLFQGMSEVELDRVLASFALSNCQVNQELLDILAKYLLPQNQALAPERVEA